MKIEWTSSELNDASWVLHEEIQKYQQIDADLFNNLKGCLKEAIEVFLTKKLEEKVDE